MRLVTLGLLLAASLACGGPQTGPATTGTTSGPVATPAPSPPPSNEPPAAACGKVCAHAGKTCSDLNVAACEQRCQESLSKLPPTCNAQFRTAMGCAMKASTIKCLTKDKFDVGGCEESSAAFRQCASASR